MLQVLSEKMTGFLTDYLEDKTQRQFSLNKENAPDVCVESFFDLLALYFFRSLDSYEKFYLEGRFETPYLTELLSSLPQKKRVNTYQTVLLNFANLYSQPMAVLPFLCDDDLSFLGFFQTESSEKHLEKIAHFLSLDPLDEVLEFGLSPGHGQTYLMKTFGCSIHTLVFSSEHRLAIENILGQSAYRHKFTISNFSKSFEKKSNYTKIVFNGFFEPLGDLVFKKFLTVIEHLSSKNKPIKIYFQGILSPSYEKVLQEHFKKECQYSKIYYHRQALSYLSEMQDSLVGAQEVFGIMMYRSWRLYFSKAHLAMTRWGYLPLSLEITIQPH